MGLRPYALVQGQPPPSAVRGVLSLWPFAAADSARAAAAAQLPVLEDHLQTAPYLEVTA